MLAVNGMSLESVTCAVKFDVPVVVGVPEIVFVVALNVKPGGSVPTRLMLLSGAVPPLAVSVVL